MKAGDFTKQWIRANELLEDIDLDNDYTIPVKVFSRTSGVCCNIEEVQVEKLDGPEYTVWIMVREV